MAFKFGYQLGLADATFEFLPVFVRAHKDAAEKANVFFLSGHLRALSERDRTKWEEALEKIAEDPRIGPGLQNLLGGLGL